jgi:hypothetical protein
MATRAAARALGGTKPSRQHWLLLGLLGAALLALFHLSLDPHHILFANDLQFGALKAACNQLPSRFAGTWRELTWLGGEGAAAAPSISSLFSTVFSPLLYLKIYAPFTLLFLGFSAWLFFRQLNFHPMVCLLGGIAAGLNAHFFSFACWGSGVWNIAAGCTFLAMAALYAKSIPKLWEKAVLAGLAIGMGVMEGFDVGVILSVYAGIFIVFRFLNDDAPVVSRLANAVLAETLVVIFAAIISASTLLTLIRTQVEGVAQMEQDAQTKQERWRGATQWSLPKLETLQVLVPGLFGYRLSGNITETNHGGAYWGLVGQDPRLAQLASDDPNVRSNVVWSLTGQGAQYSDLESEDPVLRSNAMVSLKVTSGFLKALDTPDRFSRTAGLQAVTKKSGIYWRYLGSGECAGTIVSLLALFGLANYFRQDRPYSKTERMAVGYWGVVAIFSLLAAWGRFGFVYQLLYKLPYFSTIRNPIKFMNPFHIAWIVLAGYGMEVLYRRYLRSSERSESGFLLHHLQVWWGKVTGFDRKWTIFMMVLAGVSVAAALLLFAEKGSFIRYLEGQNFTAKLASQISVFCLQEVFLFLVFLAAGFLTIAAIISGAWSGSSSKWAWGALLVLMLCDLARADAPWIHYYDYTKTYDDNSVVEFLRDKPWEHRVIGKLEPRGPGSGIQQGFGQLYFFWLQNQFPYHNIQALDFSQASHMPDLDRLYLKNFELKGADFQSTDLRPAVRLWQLTNTRYILASAFTPGGLTTADYLNERADPVHRPFKVERYFGLRLKPGIPSITEISDLTAQMGVKGERGVDLGIIENTRALPRAKLYSNWSSPTNDESTLAILANQDFDPWATVLLATNSPVPQTASGSTSDPGTVTITDYHPKNIRLEADAKTAAILLLNDRNNPNWRVRVDGALTPMLRCNYIMRGVYLTPGHHLVEFQFRPSLNSLYFSLSAIVLGIILAGYLILSRAPAAAEPVQSPSIPAPASPARPAAPTPRSAAPPPRPPGAAARPSNAPVGTSPAGNSTKGQKGNGKPKGRH